MQRLAPACLMLLVLAACGPSRRDRGDDPDTGACVPDAAVACKCADGRDGTATCSADGESVGACECPDVHTCEPATTEACACADGSESVRTCRADGTGFGACACEGGSPVARACVVQQPGGAIDESLCTRLGATPPFVPDVSFGTAPITNRQSRIVRVFNEGDADLRLASVSLEGGSGTFTNTGPASGTVAPGASIELALSFLASSPGSYSGTAVLATNAPDAPTITFRLAGTATAPTNVCLGRNAIDFGSVDVGSTTTVDLSVRNCGSGRPQLRGVTLEGANAASFDAHPPPLPVSMGPSEGLVVDVTYSPRAVRAEGEPPETATLVLTLDTGTMRVPLSGRGRGDACAIAPPVADLRLFDGTRELADGAAVATSTALTLDGTASTGAAPIAYDFRLVGRPAPSTAVLTTAGGTGMRAFAPDVAGEFQFQLVVRDANGCASEPATRRVVGTSSTDRLEIQLTWLEQHSDLDVHYVGPGGTPFDAQGDTFYENKNPDWGLSGSTSADAIRSNDPLFELDDLWGTGPEIITHSQPFDATFHVYVHDYCSRKQRTDPSSGAATAVVKIYVDGAVTWQGQKQLTQRDVWEAAVITVSGGRITVTPSSAPVTKTTVPDHGCTSDTR